MGIDKKKIEETKRLFIDRDGTCEYRWVCNWCNNYHATASKGICDICNPPPDTGKKRFRRWFGRDFKKH